MNILKALGLTAAVAITIILLLVTLYVSVWIILAGAVILLFTSILKLFKAKDHLLQNSKEL